MESIAHLSNASVRVLSQRRRDQDAAYVAVHVLSNMSHCGDDEIEAIGKRALARCRRKVALFGTRGVRHRRRSVPTSSTHAWVEMS